MPAAGGSDAEDLLRPALLDICWREKAREIAADNLISAVALDSLGTGIPTEDLAPRIHAEDGVILDSVEEHPVSFFAFPERVFPKPAPFFHPSQMLLGILAHANIADRRCYQDSFGTFERAEHDLQRKLASVLAPPHKFNSGADLLCQCLRRASGAVSDQPFRKTLRNDVSYFLSYQLVSAVSKLVFRLNIQQDDFSGRVDHDHRIRSRLQQASVPRLGLEHPRLGFEGLPRAGEFLGLSRKFQCVADQGLCSDFAFRDVRLDGNVLPRVSIRPRRWNYRRFHPVDRSVLCSVLDLTVPNRPIRDGMVHLLEEIFGVVAGF